MLKENKIKSGLTHQGLAERNAYNIFFILFFALGGFATYEFLYDLCNIIGACVSGSVGEGIKHLLYRLPVMLTAFCLTYLGFRNISIFHAETRQKRSNGHKISGIVSAVFGIAIIVYVIASVACGRYSSYVIGLPFAFFPLNYVIYGILFIIYGIYSFAHGFKVNKSGTRLPFNKNRRNPVLRVILAPFIYICYMIISYMFAASVYGIFYMDWLHGALLFNISVMLIFTLPWLMLLFYRLGYMELKDKVKGVFLKRWSLIFLIANALSFALYLLASQLYHTAAYANAAGLFPIDFSASFVAVIPVTVMADIVPPIITLIRSGKESK